MLVRALRFQYAPVNAHLIPVRRCNLSCTYCNEYDDHSAPVPLHEVLHRVDRLAALGTGIVTLSGGEPLLHPDLDAIIRRIREHGSIATLITNGYLLSRDRIRRLNRAGLDHLQARPSGHSARGLWPRDLRREYHSVKRCAPLCTVGCVHRVAQVDELRQNPQLTLSRWFPAPVGGGRARLPPAVRILIWAFVTSPRRDLFRHATARVFGGCRAED